MTIKHELEGGWALLREDNEVTERGRREVRKVMYRLLEVPGLDTAFGLAADGETDRNLIADRVNENADAIRAHMGDAMELMEELQDVSIMSRVKEWSYTDENGVALPIVKDSLLDLPGLAYDALKELCKELPTGLDMEPSPDPKAPTSNSTG